MEAIKRWCDVCGRSLGSFEAYQELPNSKRRVLSYDCVADPRVS